ncbi:MAG: GAF domain-containing sensor histidine kinase [Bacteroidota bacterium]
MKILTAYPTPRNESRRLKALHDYEILDTITEKEYDAITKIAAQICNVPVSLITFLDKDRQWFKSHLGIEIDGTPREFSFCNYTIMDADNVLVVPDLRVDERFAQNPLVAGEPHAVFYAGAPLVTPDGFVLGSICVLDAKVNNLSEDQKAALKALADQVVTKLELRKNVKALKHTQQKLKTANKNLKSFARIVSHDMKTPLANIMLLTRSFQTRYQKSFDNEGSEFLNLVINSAKELLVFIDDILVRSEKISEDNGTSKKTDSFAVINKVITLVAPPDDIEIKVSGNFPKVPIDKTSLQQVFQNLITNAIKYNDKKKGMITITSQTDDTFHYFNVADNGVGIEKKHLNKIFKERQTLDVIDRYGNKGTGIGLATVKNIIETKGGKITVASEKSIGTHFRISIPCTSMR